MTTTSYLIAQTPADDYEAALALFFSFCPARFLGLFSQRQPIASTASKDFLRRLLADKAAAHPEEVRVIRVFFNSHAIDGEPIWQMHVSGAIAYLKTL